jgi:tetratricopeptide (TPR) repeat protein
MQVASVIGRDFAYNILQAITGMQDDLKVHLLNLQEYEFIYEKTLFPELEYIFKHSVTQEVAYNSLLLNMRRKTHERIGEAIELLYPDRIEEFYEILAHHYSMSENSRKAYYYLKLSGEKAERNYSNWEALRFYKKAIEILNKEHQSDETKRQGIEIRLSAEGPMRLLGYPDDSLLILLDGERLCRELDDRRSLASLHSRLSLCYTFKGEPTKGINYAEIAFQEAEQVQDVHLAAPTGFDLCCSYTIAGEHLKIADIAPRVIDLLERTRTEREFFSGPHNFNLYSALSVYYGYSLGNLGDFRAGRKMCEKGVRFAHKIDNAYSIGFAEILYGSFFTIKGDGKNAVAHLKRAVKYGEENQIIPLIGLAWLRLGWGYYLTGKRKQALENIKKALKIQTDAGLSMNLSQYYYYLGAIYFDDNDLDEALVNTQEALELAQTLNEKHLEGNASVLMGRIKGRMDKSQKQQAERLIIQGIQFLDELKLKPFLSVSYMHLGEYYAEFGQKKKALKALTKAKDMFEKMEMVYWLRRTKKGIETLQS